MERVHQLLPSKVQCRQQKSKLFGRQSLASTCFANSIGSATILSAAPLRGPLPELHMATYHLSLKNEHSLALENGGFQ